MSNGSFSTTPEDRYLEDYMEGAVHEFGPIDITEDEIVQFGNKFDPQIFHTDPNGAKKTVYCGLIASGWHTCSLFSDYLWSTTCQDQPVWEALG